MRVIWALMVVCSTGAASAGPEELRVAPVQVQVRDASGKPASGARVYAFSQRWRIRFPLSAYDSPDCATADERGECRLQLPVGRYTFCAAPGWNTLVTAPGNGFFLVARDREVPDQETLVLSPDGVVRVHANPDRYPDLASGRAMAFPDEWGPVIEALECAHLRAGDAAIATTSDAPLTVYLHSLYEVDRPVVRLLAAPGVKAGAALSPDLSDEQLASLDIEVQAPDGSPGNANVVFGYGTNPDGAAFLLPVRGSKRILVPPGHVDLHQCEIWDGDRCTQVRGADFQAAGGDRHVIRFGGPLQPPRMLFDHHTGTHTEYWLDVRDKFGNPLMPSSGHATGGEIALLRGGEALALKPRGPGYPYGYVPKVFGAEERPEFVFRYRLGAYGPRPALKGRFDDDLLRYTPSMVRLPHVDLFSPPSLPAQTAALANLIRRTYDTYSDLLGSGPDHFVAYVMLCGLPGGPWPHAVGVVNIDALLGQDLAPMGKSGFMFAGIALHELGHAFVSGFPPHREPWYASSGIVESWPTLLRAEALRQWHGDQIGDSILGRECVFVLKHLADAQAVAALPAPTRQLFVDCYLRQKYGWGVMRRFFQLSYAADGSAPACLRAADLTDVEAVASLYSQLCEENLAWLYRALQFAVSDEKVERGVAALQGRGPH